MNKILISCDPGTKYTAFAVFKDRKLIEYTKLRPTLSNVQAFFEQYESFEFAIEDQYLNLNVKTLIKLVTIRTMITTIARITNATNCIVISPSKWQSLILGVHIRAKRDQRKRLSCMVASSIAKETIKDDNIADAICIGEYVIRKKFC